MTPGTAFSWPGGAKAAVSLTFDDARPSQVDKGLDVLAFYGFKATFYVQPVNVKERLEGWKKAVAGGHEMGNHTVSHPCSGNFPWAKENALEDYDLERMEKELLEANQQIAELLGVTPRTFGYPCGQTFVGRSRGVRSYVPLVAKHFLAGRAYMTEHLNDPAFCDLAQLGCSPMDGLASADLVSRIDECARAGAWVIFAGHETAERGFQVTKLAALEKLCEWLRAPSSGIWTVPVEEVTGYLLKSRVAGKGG